MKLLPDFLTSKTAKPERNPLKEAYEYRLTKLREMKEALTWNKVEPPTYPDLSPEEGKKILASYEVINASRLEDRMRRVKIKGKELAEDKKYQQAKQLMTDAKVLRDQIVVMKGISQKEAACFLYDKSSEGKRANIPQGLKDYQERFIYRRSMENAEQTKRVQAVADILIQQGKVFYEPHPDGGRITHFQGIPGIGSVKFYDATRLVQKKKITNVRRYQVFGRDHDVNLVQLSAIGNREIQKWTSLHLMMLVDKQCKKYGL